MFQRVRRRIHERPEIESVGFLLFGDIDMIDGGKSRIFVLEQLRANCLLPAFAIFVENLILDEDDELRAQNHATESAVAIYLVL